MGVGIGYALINTRFMTLCALYVNQLLKDTKDSNAVRKTHVPSTRESA